MSKKSNKRASMRASKKRTPWGYATSDSPEFWQHAGSRVEAVREAQKIAGAVHGVEPLIEGGSEGWIVQGAYPPATDFIPDADRFIEDMEQVAIDNGCPDEIDEPFEFKRGASSALEKALEAWAKKYVIVKFWNTVGKAEKVVDGPSAVGAPQIRARPHDPSGEHRGM